jgi:RHS repeat-associated protein
VSNGEHVVISSPSRPVIAVILIALCIPVAVLSRYATWHAVGLSNNSPRGSFAGTGTAILASAVKAIFTNPHVPPGAATTIASASGNLPLTGSWDVVRGSDIVATNTNPVGWNVAYAAGNLTITVPATQFAATAFEARFDYNGTGNSASFDVVPRITAGGIVTFWVPMGNACAAGVTWDIVRNGTTIATSSAANGWIAERSQRQDAPVLPFAMRAPYAAVIGQNYEFRYSDGHSTPFDVGYSVPTNIHPGVTNGVLEDAMTLPGWMEHLVPTDTSDAPGGGPASVISIDLVHGVSTINPEADLVASNPNGEDVVFARQYRSVLAAGNLSSPGLPPGWTHNWDFRIVPLAQSSWGSLQLVYPNGASELLIPILDGTQNPTGGFAVSGGVPYIASGTPSATPGVWTQIVLSHNGSAKEVFNLVGGTVYRLTQEIADNGSVLNLSYTSQALTQIDTHFVGGPNTVLLNIGLSNGFFGSVTDPIAAHSRTFSYSGGELSAVSQVNSATIEWSYQYTTIAGQPYVNSVQTMDPHGTNRAATIGYDTDTGRATLLTDAKGQTHGYSFAFGQGGSAQINGPSGVEDQYGVSADQSGRILSVTTMAGDVTSVAYGGVDPSVQTTVTPPLGSSTISLTDSHGNVTRVTYPYGNYTDYTWDYPTVAPFGRLTQVQEFGNDGSAQLPITYDYYGSGDPDGQEGFLKEVAYANGGYEGYTYTSKGNLATVTAPNTKLTFTYELRDAGGQIIAAERYGKPYKATNLLNETASFQYDSAGRLIGLEDPMGIVSSANYNQYSQVTSFSVATGDPLETIIQSTYSVPGKAPTLLNLTATGQGTVNLLQAQYDSESAVSAVLDANSHSNSVALNGQFGLKNLTNGNGNLLHQSAPNPLLRKYITTFGTGANALATSAILDANGNVASGSGSNGRVFVVTPLQPYTGLVSSTLETDPATGENIQNEYVYDAFGRIQTTNSITLDSTISIAHNYNYDDAGRIKSDTVSGHVPLFQYEPAYFPWGVTYQHNPNGTRFRMFVGARSSLGYPPNQACYTYSYDLQNRITNISVDLANYNLEITGPHITSVQYEYDATGRVIACRSPKLVTRYAYNALGQLTKLENLTPDGSYDHSAPTQYRVTDNGGLHTVLSSFSDLTYDALSNRTGMSFVAVTRTGGLDANGAVAIPSTYKSGTAVFGYDAVGKLTSESWSGDFGPTVSYTHAYDAGDNLTTLRNVDYNRDPLSDQIINSPNAPGYANVAYNSSGEMTWLRGGYQSYNASGDLSLGETWTVYPYSNDNYYWEGFNHYDDAGLRMQKNGVLSSGPGTPGFSLCPEQFLYDAGSLVFRSTGVKWSDVSYQNNWSIYYVWGPTGPVVEFQLANTHLSKGLSYDPHGSAVATVNGTPPETTDVTPLFYDGYGVPVWTYDSIWPYPHDPRAMEQPFQYKGQYGYFTDAESNLVYCQNRYYDPQSGRWLSRDPIGLEGGVNVYQYCGGNPIMFADPSGLEPPSGAYWKNWSLRRKHKAGKLRFPLVTTEGSFFSYPKGESDLSSPQYYYDKPDGTIGEHLWNSAVPGDAVWAIPAAAGLTTTQRIELRAQWEDKYGYSWPTDPVTGRPCDIDHIKPRSMGGTDHVENIRPLARVSHTNRHIVDGHSKMWGQQGAAKRLGNAVERLRAFQQGLKKYGRDR